MRARRLQLAGPKALSVVSRQARAGCRVTASSLQTCNRVVALIPARARATRTRIRRASDASGVQREPVRHPAHFHASRPWKLAGDGRGPTPRFPSRRAVIGAARVAARRLAAACAVRGTSWLVSGARSMRCKGAVTCERVIGGTCSRTRRASYAGDAPGWRTGASSTSTMSHEGKARVARRAIGACRALRSTAGPYRLLER